MRIKTKTTPTIRKDTLKPGTKEIELTAERALVLHNRLKARICSRIREMIVCHSMVVGASYWVDISNLNIELNCGGEVEEIVLVMLNKDIILLTTAFNETIRYDLETADIEELIKLMGAIQNAVK